MAFGFWGNNNQDSGMNGVRVQRFNRLDRGLVSKISYMLHNDRQFVAGPRKESDWYKELVKLEKLNLVYSRSFGDDEFLFTLRDDVYIDNTGTVCIQISQ